MTASKSRTQLAGRCLGYVEAGCKTFAPRDSGIRSGRQALLVAGDEAEGSAGFCVGEGQSSADTAARTGQYDRSGRARSSAGTTPTFLTIFAAAAPSAAGSWKCLGGVALPAPPPRRQRNATLFRKEAAVDEGFCLQKTDELRQQLGIWPRRPFPEVVERALMGEPSMW